MNFDLMILLQRMIELLAFYLILANFDGNGLKESIGRLFSTKQKGFLYGNIIVLIVYPLALTVAAQATTVPGNVYGIDDLLRLFVTHFLLRRAFNFKDGLLAGALSSTSALMVAMFNWLFIPLSVTAMYLAALVIIIAMSYQKHFKFIYIYISKKSWLLNIICLLSLALYGVTLSISFSVPLGLSIFLIFFLISVYLHNKNRLEISAITTSLENATLADFFQLLKELSLEHKETEIINQYIIRDSKVNQLMPILSKQLEAYKNSDEIRAYECITTKWQIKINAVL